MCTLSPLLYCCGALDVISSVCPWWLVVMLLWVLRNEVSGVWLLRDDPVRCHPGSLYAAVGGAQQSDCNPTLDVSTRLRVGLLPLGVQATD